MALQTFRSTIARSSQAAAARVQAGGSVADAAVVRRRYEGGASVRLLHPQRYCDAVWRVLALLEDQFQCAMGCNVYLTPPASQVCCSMHGWGRLRYCYRWA
jgi:hypothetical protein